MASTNATKVRVSVLLTTAEGSSVRIAIPISPTSTLEDLSNEISRRRKTVGTDWDFTLEDGSELWDLDEIGDIYKEGETLHARPRGLVQSGESKSESKTQDSTTTDPKGNDENTQPLSGSIEPYVPHGDTSNLHQSESLKRVKLSVITAESARNHGQQRRREIPIFGGSSVSVRLTMDVIRNEVGRVLGWANEDITDYTIHTPPGDNIHTRCSCSLATQIRNEGHFDTFHCPSSVDGTQCEKGCSYSHAKLDLASSQTKGDFRSLLCDICTEPLSTPCERCLREQTDDLRGFCPLVQNAGCYHLFHAHCYYGRVSGHVCPAGCPAATYSREPVPFGTDDSPIKPHLLVVHSGAKVDRIEIPKAFLPTEGDRISMKDQQVMDILREQYKSLGSGLTVFMHGRGSDNFIRFRHSSMVTICGEPRHPEGGTTPAPGTNPSKDADWFSEKVLVRFALNGPPPKPQSNRYAVDLHTAESPIFNLNPNASIEYLGLDDGVPDGGVVVLYAVRRMNDEKEERRGVLGKVALYSDRPEWHPMISQTPRGVAAYLSALLMFTHVISHDKNAEEVQRQVLVHFLSITRFPPAARALYLLLANDTPEPEDRRALSETIYHLIIDFVPVPSKPSASVFERARILFGVLLHCAQIPLPLPQQMQSNIRSTSIFTMQNLTCELTRESLRSAVILAGQMVEEDVARTREAGGCRWDPSKPTPTVQQIEHKMQSLIRRSGQVCERVVVLDSSFSNGYGELLSHGSNEDFANAIVVANSTDLVMHAPLELKSLVSTPALTLDGSGLNAVYFSRGDECGNRSEDLIFLCPSEGKEVTVDVNDVAAQLAPIIELRKANKDWAVDAFGTSNDDRMDTRDIEEAIVICLDISKSMDSKFVTNGNDDEEENDEEVDGDALARRTLLENFRKRPGARKSLVDAKRVLEDLPFLQSMACYVLRKESNTHSEWKRLVQGGSPQESRAKNALEELAILLSREYLQSLPFNRFNTQRLQNIEAFCTVAWDETLNSALVSHLISVLRKAAAGNSEDTTTIPTRFRDPLTGELMNDPVVAADGHTYERKSLEAWLKHTNTSPKNPTVFLASASQATTDSTLKREIKTWRKAHSQDESSRLVRPWLVEIGKLGLGNARNFVFPYGESPTLYGMLFHIWLFDSVRPSKTELWTDLEPAGDGTYQGYLVKHFWTPGLASATISKPPGTFRHLQLQRCFYEYRPSPTEAQKASSRKLSRLDIVKIAFDAFVTKQEVYNFPIALGLVTFGETVRTCQELTILKTNFRAQLEGVSARGDTPLYDSISTAKRMLEDFRKEHPNARLRIICLTDGEDKGSKITALEATKALQTSRIKLDALLVDDNTNLHAMAVASGGYSFRADNLQNALAIVELETMISSKERIERLAKPTVRIPRELSRYSNLELYPMDEVSRYHFPGRKPHAKLGQRVRPASLIMSKFSNAASERTKRIVKELETLVNSPHPAIDVYASDSDIGFWRVVIEGPNGSPYEGGTFMAYVDFPESYPQNPPEIRFVTGILHPNINRDGKVCLPLLGRAWVSSMRIKTVLEVVYGLLLTPDTDNPIDLHATMEYNDDTGQHALRIQEMVQTLASKTRDEWRTELE